LAERLTDALWDTEVLGVALKLENDALSDTEVLGVALKLANDVLGETYAEVL
jgi:hypothetical protein